MLSGVEALHYQDDPGFLSVAEGLLTNARKFVIFRILSKHFTPMSVPGYSAVGLMSSPAARLVRFAHELACGSVPEPVW